MITLEDLIEEIFGKSELTLEKAVSKKKERLLLIENTFPGDMRISEFNEMYDEHLEAHETETLAELVTKLLGHTSEGGRWFPCPLLN